MSSLLSLLRRSNLRSTRSNLYSPRSNLSTISSTEVKSKLECEYDPEKLITAFQSLQPNLDPSASRYANKIVIKRLAKARRFTDIETLLENLKQSPKSKNELFFSNLIFGYGNAGMLDQAVHTFHQMDELETPRTILSFNELLSTCNRSKNFDQVPKLFNEIPEKYGISPDKTTYKILIKSLCESGLPESGYLILDLMKGSNIEITIVVYTTLLEAFYKKNKLEDCKKIWDEMIENGCKPNLYAFTVRLSYIAFNGTIKEALVLLDEMVLAGVKPDTAVYNYLITCYCRNGKIEDAKEVYKGLEGYGCAPNFVTFKHFIIHLCKVGDYEFAFEVGMESIRKDRVPDFGTMKLLIQGLAGKERFDYAKELLSEVKGKFPASMENVWKGVEKKIGLDLAASSGKEEATL